MDSLESVGSLKLKLLTLLSLRLLLSSVESARVPEPGSTRRNVDGGARNDCAVSKP